MSTVALDTAAPQKTQPLPLAKRSATEAPARRYNPPALATTPHPEWITAMVETVKTEWEAACWPRLFKETAEGKRPPLRVWQRMLTECFFIVENFPKYMGLSLAKTTYGKRPGDSSARRWLLQNMAVEAKHSEWWLDWAAGTGIDPEQLFNHTPMPEVMELHTYLMELCAKGTLAEGVAASNWAVEGVTGVWTHGVEKHFREYAAEGARIDGVSMMWLKAHARYDDAHPHEALEIIKAATNPLSEEPARVTEAARKSLELLAKVWEACYAAEIPEAG
ncbi:TenA family transcriptional regulator [Hyalangium rubrum]|uniref:Iron-containing redox enzyme family protein n=1 Tax=Hyalangium rubrum TaxID=3103134 RepID=A0ABU5H3K0_9BACT|nr:iron-containing redox enzyme family protein [Hyalangium sp. s54d21]MDY7226660.1 iron-containing redox enzyme family protein [Hyalangium sp. s54d21]